MQDEGMRRAGPTRREVILGAGVSALALTATRGLAEAPSVASGSVFEDRSGTGIRRAAIRASPAYSSPTAATSCAPTPTGAGGCRSPTATACSSSSRRTGRRPWGPAASRASPHLHQPDAARWPAIDRFPLRRQPESARFEALLLADPQPENHAELAYLRDGIIAATLPIGAQFAIVHGDVVGDDHSLYPRYLRLLAATGIPWHHCPGNHDMDLDARDDHTSRETWKRVFGPRHYAFQHAGATFLVLDNVHYRGWNPGRPLSGTYCGRIGAEQLAFVRNVLAHVPPEELIVLSMHIPLTTCNDPANPADTTADTRALLALLSGRPHTVSFSGHMHTAEHHYLGADHGFAGPGRHHHQVLAAASGSWWGGPRDGSGMPIAVCPDGTPNGFHVLSVDGPRYATRFVPAAGKGPQQLRVLVDAHALIVNVFDGGPATAVTCQVAGSGGTEVALQRTQMADPYAAELIAAHPATFKSWVRAVASSHVWRAPLPAGLAPGAHRVTVRARQPGGAEHVAHIVLEVAAPSGQRSA